MKGQYFIRVENKAIEVTQEVYETYYRMGRREKYLAERDYNHKLLHYSALDAPDLVGEELIADNSGQEIEEQIIQSMVNEELHNALEQLKDRDREIITELYFNDLTERELAKRLGIKQQTLNERKKRILKDLKKVLKNSLSDRA